MRLGRYRHYKGNYYEVLRIVRNAETEQKMVLYRGLYQSPDLVAEYGEDPWFVRPFDAFFESVPVDGKMVPRFEFVAST
jgi:hypothetical protein